MSRWQRLAFRAKQFDPRTISGIVAWFDASDDSTFTLSGTAVSEWRDKSGNGYSVSQSTGNNQPARTGTVLGRPTVDFDGVNDYLASDSTGLSSALSGDNSLTVFIVGQMHTAAEYAINSQGTWLSWGSTSSGTPFVYVRSTAGSGNAQIALRNDASSTNGQVSTAPGPIGDGAAAHTGQDSFVCSATIPSQAASVLRMHTISNNEGDGTGRSTAPVNGATTTASLSRPAGNTTVNRFTIGALGRNTFSDFFPARISEVIVYSRAISDLERAQVVQLLGRKYATKVPVL